MPTRDSKLKYTCFIVSASALVQVPSRTRGRPQLAAIEITPPSFVNDNYRILALETHIKQFFPAHRGDSHELKP